MPRDPLPALLELPAEAKASAGAATRVRRVLRLRLKDKHAAWLSELARETNLIWNYCNELSVKVFERERRFMSGYDLQKYLTGATTGEDGLHLPVQAVQQIAEEYARRRRQFKKVKLSWRKSGGARRNLGWIPFKVKTLRYRNGQIWFAGRPLSLWDSYGLADYTDRFRSGNLSEDARGRWYLNICIEVDSAAQPKAPTVEIAAGKDRDVALDLGLKTLAALSAGTSIDAQQFYRDFEPKLAIAQRARKKARAKAIHAKVANWRKDYLHKASSKLVQSNDAIYFGNVNATAIAKSRLGKSSLDAGWSMFRTMLRYKCDGAGVRFEEVDESYTTQTCSECGALGGPKGIAGLGMRGWRCVHCGAVHDRDTNAALNILARGRARLAEGIPRL